ncbi:MAG: azurin [Pseudoalteromonas tetraodonis]|jgi:azurin
MDDSQEMTTPLNRFFTFWWILAGFAVFGLLALIASLFSDSGDDKEYSAIMATRLATQSEVVAAQKKQLEEVKLDLTAGVVALKATKPTASTTAVPGSPTHQNMMAEMAAKAAADAAAAASPDAQKLTVHTTNPTAGEPPMQFKETELTAEAGKPIELNFLNVDTLLVTGHNIVICKPGTRDAVAALAMSMAADPEFVKTGYVPTDDDVIAASKLLTPGQSEVVKFTLTEPGDYPYVCTFPGHSFLMKGVLKVK